MLLAVFWVKFTFSDLQLQERVAREKSIRGSLILELGEVGKKIKIRKQRKRR